MNRVYLTYHGDGNVGIGTPPDAPPPQVVMGEPVEHLRVSMTDGATWNKAVQEERSACVKACEASADTGNDTGIERDVAVWNKAVAYCVRRLKERSNAELTGDGQVHRPESGGL